MAVEMWWPNAFASWEAVQYLSTWGVLGFQAAEEILVRGVENHGRRTVVSWHCHGLAVLVVYFFPSLCDVIHGESTLGPYICAMLSWSWLQSVHFAQL